VFDGHGEALTKRWRDYVPVVSLLSVIGCFGTNELPEPADTSPLRAAQRGAAAPDPVGLRRAVLIYAAQRRTLSHDQPTRMCVEAVEDANWLANRGVDAVAVNLNSKVGSADLQGCLAAGSTLALFVHQCQVMRWWDNPDEYEVYSLVMHGPTSRRQLDKYVVFVAVHHPDGWRIVRSMKAQHCYDFLNETTNVEL
jgi:hypothetical protein